MEGRREWNPNRPVSEMAADRDLNQPGLHRSSDSERIEPLIGFHEDILRQLFARLTIAENRRGTPPLHSPKRCVVIGFRVG